MDAFVMVRPTRALRRAGKWLGGSVVVALAGWSTVGLAQYALGTLKDEPAPVNVQLAHLYQSLAADGWRVVESRQVALRGTDERSRVLVVGRREGADRKVLRESDELRIYDLVDGRLTRRFRYQPLVDLSPLPREAGVTPLSKELMIKLRHQRDLDGDGREEIVAAFARNGEILPFPALIVWNPLRDAYELVPLMGARTKLEFDGVLRDLGSTPDPVYRGLRIYDSHTKHGFRSLVVDAFEIVAAERLPLLVAIHPGQFSRRGPLMRIRSWHLFADGVFPPVLECPSGPLVRAAGNRSPEEVLKAQLPHLRRSHCV